jgi:pimeloyl-ACP methyl ester carboxylesterase
MAYPDIGTTPLNYLSSSVQLKMVSTPDLNVLATYNAQVATMDNRLISAGGLHILVGHSLGALVARGAYNYNASARPLYKGIVAIAPPHQGAIIADNALTMRAYIGDVQRRINDAVPALLLAADVYTLVSAFAVTGGTAVGFVILIPLNFFIVNKAHPLDLATFSQLLQVPALNDLKPNSHVIDSLNNLNLASDASLQRAQVIGSIPLRYAAIRVMQSALNDDAGFSATTKTYRAAIKSFKVCKYWDYGTILGWGLGRRCGWAARALGRLDDRWTRYTIGTDAFGQPANKPFDGVVPNERSIWPGSIPLSFQATVPNDHMNIYKTRVGLDQVAQAMYSVGASAVNPPPPPPAITVSIAGPARVRPNVNCAWQASVSGGTPPYSYNWTKTGGFNGYDSEALTSFSSSGTLYLQVGDAAGNNASTSKAVSVSSSNPFCPL